MLDTYKKEGGDWASYEKQFLELMASPTLCSEPQPDHCHRRLVAEYLRDKWGDVEIAHL